MLPLNSEMHYVLRMFRKWSPARLAIVTVIAGSVIGSLALPAVAAPLPIIIAFEGPLTGSQSNNGIDMYRGVKLAVDQVNAKGGVLGRKVVLVKADDQANPDLAVKVAQQVKDAGAVAVIGPINSAVGIINLPFYIANGITPVQLTGTKKTSGEGVTVKAKASQISRVEIAYLTKPSGCGKVVMLVDPSAYTQEMADRTGPAVECGDGDYPVTSIMIPPGLSSYSVQVAQALALDPDTLYVSTYYPEGSKIAKAITAAKPKPNMPTVNCLMGAANVDAAFVKEAGIKASQRCLFSGVPEAAQMPDASNYVSAYVKKFNTTPGVWGTFTYDSANILFAAMAKSGVTTYGPVLKKLLNTKNYPGQTGQITINPDNGNRKNAPAYIMKVNNAGVYVIDKDAMAPSVPD